MIARLFFLSAKKQEETDHTNLYLKSVIACSSIAFVQIQGVKPTQTQELEVSLNAVGQGRNNTPLNSQIQKNSQAQDKNFHTLITSSWFKKESPRTRRKQDPVHAHCVSRLTEQITNTPASCSR
jgi:hypothetical protein